VNQGSITPARDSGIITIEEQTQGITSWAMNLQLMADGVDQTALVRLRPYYPRLLPSTHLWAN